MNRTFEGWAVWPEQMIRMRKRIKKNGSNRSGCIWFGTLVVLQYLNVCRSPKTTADHTQVSPSYDKWKLSIRSELEMTGQSTFSRLRFIEEPAP
jgi:hypothetical protein